MSTNYFLTGPINVNSDFILSYIINNVAYFLTLTPDGLIFDPRSLTVIKESLAILNVSVSTTADKYNISIKSSNPLSYIATNNTGLAITSPTATDLDFINTVVAPWPGVPFLAGQLYTITANQININWQSYVPGTTLQGSALTLTVTNNKPVINIYKGSVMALANVFYGVYQSCESTTPTVGSVSSQILYASESPAPKGYTVLSECKEAISTGVQYQYCPINSNCGDGNCKGPCPGDAAGGGTFCSIKGGLYSCTDPPPAKTFFNSSWFILLIVLGVLIVIMIFMFIVFGSKKKK